MQSDYGRLCNMLIGASTGPSETNTLDSVRAIRGWLRVASNVAFPFVCVGGMARTGNWTCVHPTHNERGVPWRHDENEEPHQAG